MVGKTHKKDSFLKDSSIYTSSAVISTAIAFLTLPVFTRYLSPNDYAIISLFAMFGNISSYLLSFGIQLASYRYYFEYKDNIQAYKLLNSSNLYFVLFIYFLGGVIIIFLAEWLSSFLFDEKLTVRLIRWSFLAGCLTYLFDYFTSILTAQKRATTFSIITILKSFLSVIFSLYFIFKYSLTYLALIYGTILSLLIMNGCLVFLSLNVLVFRFSFSSLKKSLLFSYPTTPRQIIGLVHGSFDKIMLNKFTGLSSLGYYVFGAKFANILKIMTESMAKVWMPFFMERAHEEKENAKKSIIKRFYQMTFFFAICGLGIIYFSEEMIKLLTTKEFYPSMYLVPIFVYNYLFGLTGFISSNQLMYAEKLIYRLPTSIIAVFTNIFLNILLIPKYGAIGAVTASVITALITCIILLYFGQRSYPLPVGKWKLAGLFIIIMAFTIPIYPIMMLDINWIYKITIKVIIIVIFIMTGIKIGYVTQDDLTKLNFFRNKKNIITLN